MTIVHIEDEDRMITIPLNSPSINILSAKTSKTFLISNGGVVISADLKGGFESPLTGHITSVRVTSVDGIVGSIAIAVWIKPFSEGIPSNEDEVDVFSLDNEIQSEETGLSIPVSLGDWIAINVDSAELVQLVAIAFTFE